MMLLIMINIFTYLLDASLPLRPVIRRPSHPVYCLWGLQILYIINHQSSIINHQSDAPATLYIVSGACKYHQSSSSYHQHYYEIHQVIGHHKYHHRNCCCCGVSLWVSPHQVASHNRCGMRSQDIFPVKRFKSSENSANRRPGQNKNWCFACSCLFLAPSAVVTLFHISHPVSPHDHQQPSSSSSLTTTSIIFFTTTTTTLASYLSPAPHRTDPLLD